MKESIAKLSVVIYCIILLGNCAAPRKCWQLNFRNYSNDSIGIKVAVEDTAHYIDYGKIKSGDTLKVDCLTSDSYKGDIIVSVNRSDSMEIKTYTIQELRNKAMTIIYKNQLP